MPFNGAEFTIESSFTGDGTAVITLTGQLDRTTVPPLVGHLRRVLSGRPARVVYEMSLVTYLDNAAARALVQGHRRLADGSPLVLRRCPPIVRRLLEVNGLGAACVFDSEPAAGP